MKTFFLILGFVVTYIQGKMLPDLGATEVIDEEWEVFKSQFGKVYNSSEEEMYRKKVFMENKRIIAEHNSDFYQGKQNFSLKLNQFGDLLCHEFSGMMNGFKYDLKIEDDEAATFIPPANVLNIPESVDWRKNGAVTPVKNQGQCGSCWAFSSTGALEGQLFRKTGRLPDLSEQNLIDCTAEANGCQGGWMGSAFNQVKREGGIDSENFYPYHMRKEYCHFDKSHSVGTDVGYARVRVGDENALKIAVATVGPVSVAIDASHSSFQHAGKGIYYEPNCYTIKVDHAVLVVGYGSENGQDFWIVKNSWSTHWGDNGYIRMARNRGNNCGIASFAVYPLV